MIRMLPQRHTSRCRRTTLWILIAVLLAGYPVLWPATIARADDGRLPDAEQVVLAYLTAREWVNAFAMPEPRARESRVPLDDASGLAVILRHNGRVVGSAAVSVSDRTEPDMLLRRALGRALGQVLGNPAVANLPEEIRSEVGTHLTLELEVAGALEPLAGRSFSRIAERLEPGLHGVALRRGGRVGMLFPAKLRAGNAADQISTRIAGLVGELGLPQTELDTLRRDHQVGVYRFDTTHLAQRSPAEFPFETDRGDRPVDLDEITLDRVTAMTGRLMEHLTGRLWPGGETAEDHEMRDAALGLMGDYRAVSDRFSPLFAPPFEQALGAYAFARLSGADGIDGAWRETAGAFAITLLEELAVIEEGEADPIDSVTACAAIVLAASALAEVEDAPEPDLRAQRMIAAAGDEIIEQLRRATGRSRPVAGLPDDGAAAPPAFSTAHDATLVVAAAIQLIRQGREELRPDELRAMLDLIWSETAEPNHVSLFPWIVLAEREFAEIDPESGPAVDRLRSVRSLVEAARVGDRDRDDHPVPWDLRGGFALGDPEARRLRPTAQMTRPAAGFAMMLRDEALTPAGEREEALEAHRRSLRFLKQLSVRPELEWSYPNPGRARGGIRAAVWDQNQPLAAQIMALLLLVEAHESIHALGAEW